MGEVGSHEDTSGRDWLNDILLDVSEIAWANGSVEAAYQRSLAETVANHVGKARIGHKREIAEARAEAFEEAAQILVGQIEECEQIMAAALADNNRKLYRFWGIKLDCLKIAVKAIRARAKDAK